MFRKVLIIILCCLPTVMADAEKKYDLTWRFRKGLVNIMPEKSVIDRQIFMVDGDKEKLIEAEKMTFQGTAHWKVENVINKKQAAVLNIIEGEKLEVVKNGKKFRYDPNKDWSEQDEALLPYKQRVGFGIAFLLDIDTQKVLVTWDVKKQEDGSYKREMYRGKQDPYDLGTAYKQLVNKKVAIGHTWTLQRKTTQGFIYNYRYTFAGVVRHKGKSVAKIEVGGDILWNNLKIGAISGEMLHDYKTRLMREYKVSESVEQVTEQNGKKYIRRVVVDIHWYLKKTNATQQ